MTGLVCSIGRWLVHSSSCPSCRSRLEDHNREEVIQPQREQRWQPMTAAAAARGRVFPIVPTLSPSSSSSSLSSSSSSLSSLSPSSALAVSAERGDSQQFSRRHPPPAHGTGSVTSGVSRRGSARDGSSARSEERSAAAAMASVEGYPQAIVSVSGIASISHSRFPQRHPPMLVPGAVNGVNRAEGGRVREVEGRAPFC